VAANHAKDKKDEIANNHNDTKKAQKDAMKEAMKWLPLMLIFVPVMICELGVRTNNGFKEVHLTDIAKILLDHCRADIGSAQVYNHLRKWSLRWLTISWLQDLNGAQWCECEDTKTVILESEHYHGHVTVSTLSSIFVALHHQSLSCTHLAYCLPFLGSPRGRRVPEPALHQL
jgi:hypothetical protein